MEPNNPLKQKWLRDAAGYLESIEGKKVIKGKDLSNYVALQKRIMSYNHGTNTEIHADNVKKTVIGWIEGVNGGKYEVKQ